MTSRLPLFPRIPHLSGSCGTPDDLWLPAAEETELWRRPLVVLEKRDGVNVAVGIDTDGMPVVELRGGFHTFAHGALEREAWLYVMQRQAAFQTLLGPDETVYGEWLKPRLGTPYSRLPDWCVLFALQRPNGGFVPFFELVARSRRLRLTVTEPLYVGRVRSLPQLRELLGPSQFGAPCMEGLVVEPVRPGPGPRFAKWVRAGFARRRPSLREVGLTNELDRQAMCRLDVRLVQTAPRRTLLRPRAARPPCDWRRSCQGAVFRSRYPRS
jgi:hypothetical protein